MEDVKNSEWTIKKLAAKTYNKHRYNLNQCLYTLYDDNKTNQIQILSFLLVSHKSGPGKDIKICKLVTN